MSYPVVIDARAARALDETFTYYESVAPQLAATLLAAFEELIEFLGSFPKGGTPVGEALRRKALKGFPYYVLYEFAGETVNILAFVHRRRDPSPRGGGRL